MRNIFLVLMTLAVTPFCVYAVDGVVLINQSTVMAAGGFPYIINQSGSYKLSGNLIVQQTGTSAIMIAASNVTLDLNGFTIQGPPQTCNGSICTPVYGIAAPSIQTNITVRNGSIVGFGSRLSLIDSSEKIVGGFRLG